MDTPLSIDRYIKLTTKKELKIKDIQAWFRCVKHHAPKGVMTIISTRDDKGQPKSVSLVHQVNDDCHCYLIPLARDLNENEIEKIVTEFSEDRPKIDFNVETNETKLSAKDHDGITLDSAKHIALCTALAKQKHEDWVRERNGAGWRYGVKFDGDDKTHPLLMPWEQLPDRYKEPDMDWPQKLVHMLNDQGYAVIEKNELARLLDLLKGPN